MTALGRPPCLDETPGDFISSDKQCPKKPRGRKPKKNAANDKQSMESRPSAAACGFSTHNMTDSEVLAKVEKLRSNTCGTGSSNDEKPGKPGKGHRRKMSHDEGDAAKDKQPMKSRPSAAACGFSTHSMTDSEVLEKWKSFVATLVAQGAAKMM